MTTPAMGGRRSSALRTAFLAAACLFAMAFTGLGIWQIQRLSWKLGLIARVEARVHAPPTAPPGSAEWPRIDAAGYEYRRVEQKGSYLDTPETLTMAVTERGPGFWVLAAFRSEAGFTVLINRGFVPEDRRSPDQRHKAAGAGTRVVGLLRMSEPRGGFLRANDTIAGCWYSRDVAAIAQAQGQVDVAPYFVDADASSEPGPLPQGGMTQLHFRNTHLIYALIWFCLALMSVGAVAWLVHVKVGKMPAS